MAPRHRRLALAGLWLAAAGLFLAFTRGAGLASVGDDSVSYLLLARFFGGADAPVREWAAYQTHFGPLFPLVLAATGASANLARAHLEVGLFAALALVPLYRIAARRLGAGIALALVGAFLLMPTAWIGALGILSEPLFLLVALAAIDFHETRIAAPQPRVADLLVMGVLLALAALTRTGGVVLAIAYAVHAAVRALRGEPGARRLFIPAIPWAVLVGAWLALRPAPQGDLYGQVLATVGRQLAHDPAAYARHALSSLLDGWIASFTAQSAAGAPTRAALGALALVALAGAGADAWRNRLAGWYALGALAMLFFWVFPEDTMRRLLYPVVPVLLMQALTGVRDVVAQGRARARAGAAAAGCVAALAAVLCIGPALLVLEKASHRTPAYGPGSQSLAEISDYYATLPRAPAAELAGRELAVLQGLAMIARATPPDARVMWMRPDYVAVLGRREGVAWYYAEGLPGLARRLRDSGARYVVGANLYKSDMGGAQTELFATPPALAAFGRPVYAVRNPAAPIDEFILFEVDAAALREYLAGAR